MNDLNDLVRKLLKVAAVHDVTSTPHVDRIEVTTWGDVAHPKFLPGRSSVTVAISMSVPDTPQARRVLPETFDKLDRTVEQIKHGGNDEG